MFARSRPTCPNSRAAASSSRARVASLISVVTLVICVGDQSPTILGRDAHRGNRHPRLQVPETNPLFLAALSIHVLAALTCVVAGASAALSTKGTLRHIRAGRLYYWSLPIVFATATTLAAMRWAEDYPLFIIGSIAITAASAGYLHRRLRRPGDAIHITGMGTSYIALLTAFYVDNGK